MADACIIDACRTPRGEGKPGKGALAGMHPQHLTAVVMTALAERSELDTSTVDDVIWGVSMQVGTQEQTSRGKARSTPDTTSPHRASPSTGTAALG